MVSLVVGLVGGEGRKLVARFVFLFSGVALVDVDEGEKGGAYRPI